MRSYRELVVWQKSVVLVKEIYALTDHFPKEEKFGLTSQMRRSAISTPSNIAEGYARKHRQEYVQFARIAFGSGAELETQMEIAQQLNFITAESTQHVRNLLEEVMKMLNRLISALVAKP